eukprot:scaffold13154_cov27-Tisochrysis_lutea.AAC.2
MEKINAAPRGGGILEQGSVAYGSRENATADSHAWIGALRADSSISRHAEALELPQGWGVEWRFGRYVVALGRRRVREPLRRAGKPPTVADVSEFSPPLRCKSEHRPHQVAPGLGDGLRKMILAGHHTPL